MSDYSAKVVHKMGEQASSIIQDLRARLAEAEARAEKAQAAYAVEARKVYEQIDKAEGYLARATAAERERDSWKAEAQMEKECCDTLRAERDAALERVRVLEGIGKENEENVDEDCR